MRVVTMSSVRVAVAGLMVVMLSTMHIVRIRAKTRVVTMEEMRVKVAGLMVDTVEAMGAKEVGMMVVTIVAMMIVVAV